MKNKGQVSEKRNTVKVSKKKERERNMSILMIMSGSHK